MAEDVLNPAYWKQRLKGALQVGQLHQAIFRTSLGQWEKIEAKHREILARLIQPEDTILDAACGWGRLLDLLPPTWQGQRKGKLGYLGIDISKDFIELAIERNAGFWFQHGDLRELSNILRPLMVKRELIPSETGTPHLVYNYIPEKKWDIGVLISVRPMIKRNLGEEEWVKMELQLRKCCEHLLFLEYDLADDGSVE